MTHTKTILAVDDNPANLKLVCDLLEIEGYRVIRCADPNAVLAAVERETPTLILMDIGLPGMDGYQLTRVLRANPELSKTKIVALTAFAMKGDREKVFEAGCNGYITKPVDTRKLKSQIEEFLK